MHFSLLLLQQTLNNNNLCWNNILRQAVVNLNCMLEPSKYQTHAKQKTKIKQGFESIKNHNKFSFPSKFMNYNELVLKTCTQKKRQQLKQLLSCIAQKDSIFDNKTLYCSASLLIQSEKNTLKKDRTKFKKWMSRCDNLSEVRPSQG